MLKGALHVHSSYSDGQLALRELRNIFVSDGCAFACVTDHAEHFDSAKLGAYVRDCESLSDGRFRFVAGLEYTCRESMHILGYGVTSLVATRDPEEVIHHINSQGGVSVIAHPKETTFSWIETFRVLPTGIETWNSKYDGRYAPRPDTFRLLHRLRERKRETYAFYGQDLHWQKQFRQLCTVVECQSLERAGVLAALARGKHFATQGELVLPSTGTLPDSLLKRFARVRKRSDRISRVFTAGANITDRLGITVPAPVRVFLRRAFWCER